MASGGYDSVYLSIEEIRSIVIVMFHSLPPIKCLEGGRLVVACYLIGLWMVISHWVFFELFSWLVRIFGLWTSIVYQMRVIVKNTNMSVI